MTDITGDAESYRRPAFAPFVAELDRILRNIRDAGGTSADIINGVNGELDEVVVKLLDDSVPLAVDFLTMLRQLPSGDAQTTRIVADLISRVEQQATEQAGAWNGGAGSH